jgi:uncharacterized membrane protein
MPTLGHLHLVSALVALAAGAWVVFTRKGTRTHRRIGWVYAGSMLLVNVTALLIYKLTGVFGPFHVAALVSLAGLVAGVDAARRRSTFNWLERHYFFMSYSYLGLVAAAIAETATRARFVQMMAGGPTPAFWAVVVVASLSVFVVGGRIVRGRVERTLRPFRR